VSWSPRISDLISDVDLGRKHEPLIPELSGSLPVWHSENVECVAGKSSEA
jgi:hypothetical protein